MTLLNFSLHGPLAESLGWTLLHHLWQGTLVAIVAGCALRLMNRQSAKARYLIGCGFLLLIVAFPIVTASRIYDPISPIQMQPASTISLVGTSDAELKAASASFHIPWTSRVRSMAAPLLPWLVSAWFVGVLVLSARLAVGWARTRRFCLTGQSVPEAWQKSLRRIADSLGVARAVRLLQSTLVEVPMVIGWIRPVVLVPASALTGLSASQLETIFAHELAHIRRHDYLVNLLQTFAETLFFYHPAVWWMSRRIRIERENCCDDLAVAVCGNPVLYARALATLEGLRSESRAVAASGGSLRERVMRLVTASPTRCSYRWVAGISIFTLAAAVAIAAPLALLADRPAETKPVETTMRALELRQPVNESADPWIALETRSVDKPIEIVHQASVEKEPPEAVAPREEATVQTPPIGPAEVASPFEVVIAGSEIEIAPAGSALRFTFDGKTRLEQFQLPKEHTFPVTRVASLLPPDDEKNTRQARQREQRNRNHKERWNGELTVDQFIELRSAGVDAKFIRDLRTLGYGELTFQELIELRQQGVSPEFIGQMNHIGHGQLSSQQLIELRNAGVTPEYVAELAKAGLSTQNIEDLVEARQNGITPAFIQALREAGLENLSMSDIVRLHRSGINADFVRELKQYRKRKDVSSFPGRSDETAKPGCNGPTVVS